MPVSRMMRAANTAGLSELERLDADIQLAGAAARLSEGRGPRSGWIIDPRLQVADLRATARRSNGL